MLAPQKQRGLFLLPILFVLFEPLLEKRAYAQTPEDRSGNSAALTRPCAARQENLKRARKEKTKRKIAANPEEFALACLEATDSPLDIQEFFQSYVRQQTWSFEDERIVGDGWTFVRHLDKNELLQLAQEGHFAGHVTWTGGKAVVLVATHELSDGYTRVEVSAHIQGFGQNVDRFAPARDSWDLDSTGLLEKTLIAALENHFKSLHSTAPQ